MLQRTLQRFTSGMRRAPGLLLRPFLPYPVRYYAWRDAPNFGDRLTPLLLRHYGLHPLWAPPDSADLVAAGSVLDALPLDYNGYILGAGLLQAAQRRFPHARILALRGRYTRDCLHAPPSTPLGDPGLLCARLIPSAGHGRIPLGLIPHYTDLRDPRLQRIAERHPHDVALIDIRCAPRSVLKHLQQCQCLLSSSLHGLIAADALGIPNAWIRLSNRLLGGPFKFLDYASAVGRTLLAHPLTGEESLPALLRLPDPVAPGVSPAIERMHQLWRAFASELQTGPQTTPALVT